jgi:hypothetical protein
MNAHRKTATLVGILFIIGTVMGVLSVVFTGSTLTDPNYLVLAAQNQTQMVIAAMLVLTMGISLAMVPLLLYPILKQHNENLAIGYVVFRGALETITVIATVLDWLFLLVVSREYIAAGAAQASAFQALGAVLLKGGDPINALGGLVFGIGALMLYTVFYRSRLVPRWISVWGVIAILLNFTTCILILFGLQSPFDTLNSVMNFPIFLQEMVMAVWLIVKGFNSSAIASQPADRAARGLLNAA